MAELMPSLSSDDEQQHLHLHEEESEDEDDDPNEPQVQPDFQFGGILGEDGGVANTAIQQGWSYQQALLALERSSSSVPRLDVAALIAAKRKALKRKEKQSTNNNHIENSDAEDVQRRRQQQQQQQQQQQKDVKEESSDENGDTSSSSGSASGSDDSDSDSDQDHDDQVDDKDQEMEEDVLKLRMGTEQDDNEQHQDKNDEEVDREEVEAEKAAKFFDTRVSSSQDDQIEVFVQLTLSRPLLRGVAAMGYVKPTPIQAAVVPVALAGRDICASAVTGSGKTAAFLLPIMEKLLHRSSGRIKTLILTPTRELAAQCVGMMSTLGQFTGLSSALVVGGSKNVQAQVAELRARPSVVVATPGRLLDHVTNSAGVSLEDVEFLVLDEADRLLDLGFKDEVNELIKACPTERQTMLFSATMNTKVDDLIQLSLKRPVRIRLSSKDTKSTRDLEVAPRLEQEFIRVRASNEGVNREGMLLALLTRTFSTQTIVFFDTKSKAHRMMILCGLCGIQCAELHGNLTQTQRLEALEKFREGEVDVLLATDLAARGLDISRVMAVINFEMPNQVETYIHRIGRTARGGRGGRSCTLIGEGRRHLMKQIMKDAADKNVTTASDNSSGDARQNAIIRSRSIPAAVISHFVAKIESLEEHVEEVLQAEAVARMDRVAEMEANKAQNIIEHSGEIKSRPKREWFASEKQKKLTKEAAAEKTRLIKEKEGTGLHRMTRKKRRKREAMEALEDLKQDDVDISGSTKAKQVVPSIKRMARDHKREKEERERERVSRSVYDNDMERKQKNHKGVKADDSLGNGSLFAEERIAYAPKKTQKTETSEPAKSSYNSRGYDPAMDGKKKPKGKSHNKFKSKSKYKRR